MQRGVRCTLAADGLQRGGCLPGQRQDHLRGQCAAAAQARRQAAADGPVQHHGGHRLGEGGMHAQHLGMADALLGMGAGEQPGRSLGILEEPSAQALDRPGRTVVRLTAPGLGQHARADPLEQAAAGHRLGTIQDLGCVLRFEDQFGGAELDAVAGPDDLGALDPAAVQARAVARAEVLDPPGMAVPGQRGMGPAGAIIRQHHVGSGAAPDDHARPGAGDADAVLLAAQDAQLRRVRGYRAVHAGVLEGAGGTQTVMAGDLPHQERPGNVTIGEVKSRSDWHVQSVSKVRIFSLYLIMVTYLDTQPWHAQRLGSVNRATIPGVRSRTRPNVPDEGTGHARSQHVH